MVILAKYLDVTLTKS